MTGASTHHVRSRRLSTQTLRAHGRLSRDHALLAVLGGGAAVQAVVALRLARHSWFGVDAVNYLTTRGPVPSANEGLLAPYGGHWQTIPLLVYRLLFQVFGMESYLPYVAVALACHLAITFVLYALLRSVGASPWTAVLVAWLVLFYGAGAEAFMWDAPMVLTSSLLLGLVAALVMVRRRFSGRSRVVAAVLLLAAVMCSGTGLAAAVMVGLFAFFRAGPRAAALVSGPAVLAFSVWFFTVGRDGRVHVSASTLPHVPGFVWSGVTGSLGSVLGIPGTGVIVLLVLVVVLCWPHVRSAALRQLAVAGFAGALTQLVLSSFASLVVGDAAARVGRYEYLVWVLMAASVALGVEVLAQLVDVGRLGAAAPSVLPVVAVLLLAATTLQGISKERRYADFGAASARLYKSWVYGSIMAADAGEKQLVLDAGTGFNGGRFELFARPELRNSLPEGPSTPANRLAAESEYFVDVTPDDPGLSGPASLDVKGLRGSLRPDPGCVDLATDGTGPATIDVHTRAAGAEVAVTSDTTFVTTQLFRAFVPSPVRAWGAVPGRVYVATTARDATLQIVLNGTGTLIVCHR
ncbi:MAG: hypothetical protein WB797_17645 [Nocardioides sp.]